MRIQKILYGNLNHIYAAIHLQQIFNILPPKTLQYILGHGNIATTMNNYVDVKPGNEQLLQMNNMANQLIAN